MANRLNKSKDSDNLIMDIFLHVTILLIIIFLFFRLFISDLEKTEFNKQIKDQIPNLNKLYKNIDNESNDVFKDTLKELDKQNFFETMKKFYSEPDKETEEWNNNLWTSTILVIGSFLLGTIGLYLILKYNCGKSIPLFKILLENIGLFIFIGGIEIIFFLYIAKKFIPVEPSFFVNNTLKSFKDKINKFTNINTKIKNDKEKKR